MPWWFWLFLACGGWAIMGICTYYILPVVMSIIMRIVFGRGL